MSFILQVPSRGILKLRLIEPLIRMHNLTRIKSNNKFEIGITSDGVISIQGLNFRKSCNRGYDTIQFPKNLGVCYNDLLIGDGELQTVAPSPILSLRIWSWNILYILGSILEFNLYTSKLRDESRYNGPCSISQLICSKRFCQTQLNSL